MFDVIERLKAEWTDKYVVVDSPAPELARFAQATGFVKTVNMNGRCLVEFDQFNNIGWYDIDPAALKIVPKPLPKPAEAKEKAAKPAATKEAAKPAAKPAAGAAKKPSTADILAAARAKGGAAPAAKEPTAKPAAGAEKLSTAEILARARGAKAAAAPAAPAEETAVEAAPEPEAPPAAPAKKAAKAAAGGLPTTTAEKIAWCRQHDAKG
ncbi:MAG: hypothetical protein LW698_09365 [Planctomycetaceae bacterium]|jgi:hypothetical protein|nr:hypothetical protein [Planctomycetaceae bacterium]